MIGLEWILFTTSHGKSTCDSIGGFVKWYVDKQSLQKPLQDQILDYVSMVKTRSQTSDFFCISEDEMIETRKNLKNCFELGKTVKGTSKSHHYFPCSCSKIRHKFTSQDTNFVTIFYFKIKLSWEM